MAHTQTDGSLGDEKYLEESRLPLSGKPNNECEAWEFKNLSLMSSFFGSEDIPSDQDEAE
jgi:hypothetical protein